MEKVLSGLPWEVCLLYLDDIIIHGREFAEEIKRLCTVLQRLCDVGLKLSPKAHSPSAICSFSWLCGERSWPIYWPQEDRGCTYLALSTNSERCRKLPGLCSYYRHFGFADIARPLYRLTEGQREFWWTSECEDAFHRLKTLLTTAPILAFPTADDLFILDTDASNTLLGTVLSQVQGGQEKVIG